jgi:radical SAM protein with 4Fe4S-binding SPASM domain
MEDVASQAVQPLRLVQINATKSSCEPQSPGKTVASFVDSIPVDISMEQKEAIEKRNKEILEQELWDKKLTLSGRPYLAHVQFSNFCNMSCIMCWNGANPRTKKLSPELVEKLGRELGPEVSVIEPYSGSEPLALTWKETLRIAKQYGVLLLMTTNAQFLTEERFHELKDVTETLYLSIDSHIPYVYEKIRLRAKTDAVFRNIGPAIKLAKKHGLECTVNIVLMTYNAPFIADSAKWFNDLGIESINVIQMMDVNHQSHYYDALAHCSTEYINNVKEQTLQVCRERKMRLLWNVGWPHIHDFREDGVPTNQRKVMNDHWSWRMRYMHPGFCRQAYNRMRIEVDGNVTPCCYATEDQLQLGNLADENFGDNVWNGVQARDLRRGMYTGDVPSLCVNCNVREVPAPRANMPFIEHVEKDPKWKRFFRREVVSEESMEVAGPDHAMRLDQAPLMQLRTPFKTRKLLVSLAAGGETKHVVSVKVRVKFQDGVARFVLPKKTWNQLQTNVGYWWSAWQWTDDGKSIVRVDKIHCVIRHEPIPRLDGSNLGYDDEGHHAKVNLGADKAQRLDA